MSPRPERRPADEVPLQDRARENLRFIRDTMERAQAFTGVPGWGGVAMGVTALAAAWVASLQSSVDRWLLTWLAGRVARLRDWCAGDGAEGHRRRHPAHFQAGSALRVGLCSAYSGRRHPYPGFDPGPASPRCFPGCGCSYTARR